MPRPTMKRRRRSASTTAVPRYNPAEGWEYLTEWKANGRILTPGVEVSIRGERGRFRFLYAIRKPDGTLWLDFVGGRKGEKAWRSFYPDRVRTVHRVGRTTEALAEQHKAKLAAKREAA